MIRKAIGAMLRRVGRGVKPKRGDGAYVLDHIVRDASGVDMRLSERYAGQVLLIVNVASRCGFTPQYEALERLYERYRNRGFAVLAFPCNDFGAQEPGTLQDVQQFCRTTYGVQFDLFDKITVSGNAAPSLYRALTSVENGTLSGSIKWNFTKFLVGRDGRVKARIEPLTPPDAPSVVALIERELGRSPSADAAV